MPKPSLREPYAALASELIDTMIGGLKEWRPDLSYPDSHSDMQGCIRAVLRKYDVKLRAVPLDTAQILDPDEVCPICRKDFQTDSYMTRIQRFDETKSAYAHAKCVNRPADSSHINIGSGKSEQQP